MVRKIICIAVMMFMTIMIMVSVASAEELSVSEWQALFDEFTAFNQEYAEKVKNGDAPPIKCATPILSELMSKRPKSGFTSMGIFDRHDSMSFVYNTPHFVLHYTDNGSHAAYQFSQQDSLPGTPNYIYIAGQIFENVYQHTVVDLGYNPPLGDTGGPDNRIDIYFVDIIPQQILGGTVPIEINTSSVPWVSSAYMILDNDFQDLILYGTDFLSPLSVTIAHEFFHTVQFGMDVTETEQWNGAQSRTWSEMTATLMEEEHYDDVNDYYIYLPFFYSFPQWSLRAGHPTVYEASLNMYGKVAFPIFLTEKFGIGIIKDIWDGCATQGGGNWWLATDDAIRAISADSLNLGKVYREFTLWNLFTQDWARTGEYFSEAASYAPIAFAGNATSYPATITVNDTLMPDNLGANYIALDNLGSVPQGVVIAFNPDRNHPWGLQVVGLPENPATQIVVVDTMIYDSSTTTIIIPNVSSYKTIALIPSVLGGDAQEVNYSFTITELSAGVSQPNGGEELFVGVDYNITWFFGDSVTTVALDLSTDNGFSWTNIDTVANNLTLYSWSVTNTPSNQCLIRVSDVDNPSIFDESNAVFSIRTVGENSVDNPFPNPAWAGRHDSVTFRGLIATANGIAQSMKITILNLAGEKVRELESEKLTGSVSIGWNFLNESDEMVASGPYIAIISFGGETFVRKFMVLR